MEKEITAIKNDFCALGKFISEWFKTSFTIHNAFFIVKVFIVLLLILIAFKILKKLIKNIPEDKLSDERRSILQRLVRYCFYFAVVVYVLSLFGIKLSAIWGAAGIAGVALGFAAQTSVSNLISGLFIVSEKSLRLGDTIIINGITGVVDAISLLSVRVHTYDNQMVRIPNSSIINSLLTNNSYNSYRRLLINVSVAYESDLAFALETLKKAPALCPTARTDPVPNAWIEAFEDSGIKLTLVIWFDNPDFITVKNETFIAIKKVFDEAKIEIPYNKIVVHNA
ncbi:Small-conductance mechanosensitive channel [Treponema sp. JC4]|uniref:mechanosensitive ion channel family protein n=1 Tax=Treponema sp. JC4 TaxID=1124982 RepID=UPI00025B0285|nr:mechanosensitive ion channel family protein [Treponema sp. JC4]EID86323.1 Small-conductance mechanosensitive channel [Treponema sp. JC4]